MLSALLASIFNTRPLVPDRIVSRRNINAENARNAADTENSENNKILISVYAAAATSTQ